jgi:hypothetical protein
VGVAYDKPPMITVTQMNQERDDLTAALDAQREEFHRELGRRAYRIGELEEELLRVGETYETSLSWRITRPVRAAKKLLARLRRS